MNLIVLNRLLKGVASLGGLAASALAAGQVPPGAWHAIAAALAALGTLAALYAKTPSQAIAAAVPPGKAPAPPAGGAP